MRRLLFGLIGIAVLMFFAGCAADSGVELKPRVIVTCDPELDDNNSLIRYLLYAPDFDTEGLIYASSQVHWKGDGKGTTQYIPGKEYSRPGRDLGPQTSWRWAEGERFIDDVVEAYAEVYDNLKVHNADYPTPDYLKSIIRFGNVEFEGDISKDTPGSDLIKECLLDDDPRPVYIQVWGGPSTVARALKSIEEQYKGTDEWEQIRTKVSAKAKLCLSGEQDATFSEYIHPAWPDVESVVVNRGVTSLGYGAKRGVVEQRDTIYFSTEWTMRNIKSRGALGRQYRVWGDGKQMSQGDFTDYFGLSGYTREELVEMGYWVWTPPQPKGNFISEGDTPVFLNLIGNGLRAYQSVEWGGWGGRLELNEGEQRPLSVAPFAMRGERDEVLPIFLPAIQNDFAARMAWSVSGEYAQVNHHPEIEAPLEAVAKAGRSVRICSHVSDPDGDNLSLEWRQYRVGSFGGDVVIDDATTPSPTVTIPSQARSGDEIHIVLSVEDDGEPALTKYHRLVITVK